MSQADYFLKVEGAPGESQDSKHSAEIELLSFGFGCSQVGSPDYGGGLGAGKVKMSPFSFTMKCNKAGPKLFMFCATGTHVKSAVLCCRKAGKDQQDFLVVKFTDCIVSSYSEDGTGGQDPIPVQSISLNFSKIEYEYKEQNADGSLGGGIPAHFDLKTNKGG